MPHGRTWLFALCLFAAGCHIHEHHDDPGPPVADTTIEWRYYPAYDIYWSTTYGWCYWGGSSWVVVHERPSWVVIAPQSRWVVVHAGPRPYRRWERHERYRRRHREQPRAYRAPPPRAAPRSAPPRGGGKRR